MKTIHLGATDAGHLPSNPVEFLQPYHPFMTAALRDKGAFRDEGNNQWRPFLEVPGENVRSLQTFLRDAGFMPDTTPDGIFGYRTLAGVRLFQEYVRTVDQQPGIGKPDGIAGPNTWKFINQWKTERRDNDQFVCQWAIHKDSPTPAYQQWMDLLRNAKQHFMDHPHPILDLTKQFEKKSDTIPLEAWNTDTNAIHLVGIRRHQDLSVTARRDNDDLFALLIRGMVFYFWGSTDPNPGMTSRTDIPFLTEGQHKYTFGWHKVSQAKKVYQALRPAGPGVLVFRDRDHNRALDLTDMLSGLDPQPNPTINIHWSGIGKTNFSAGCQVIAGQSYLGHDKSFTDCSSFASASYGELGRGKTRGAYNLLSDLIFSYAPPGVHHVYYTLGRDEASFLSDELNNEWITETMRQLNPSAHSTEAQGKQTEQPG